MKSHRAASLSISSNLVGVVLHFKKYKHKYFAVIMCVLFIVVDYVTKQLALVYMPKDETITVIPYLFDFRFLYNDGAAFGMLDDKRWIFMGATVIFLIAGIIYFIRLKENERLLSYIVMLIISGGIGNMIDRVTTGEVIDFITFGFMDFPSFNVADCCVVIGCVLWILYLLLDIFKGRKINE